MGKKITAFAPIFSQKLDNLRKEIKKLRKAKGNNEHIKKCIHEARQLKNILRDIPQTEFHLHIKLNGDEAILLDKHPALDIITISIEHQILKITLRLLKDIK